MPQRKLIWIAIVASTLVYSFLAFYLARDPQRSFDESLRLPLVLVLYACTLVTFVMSFIAPSRIAHPFKAFIVRIALTEAVAIYGLIAAIAAHDWRLYIGPWVVALIGFVQAWPSEP